MKYLQDQYGNTLTIPINVTLFKRTISFITWSIRGDFSTDFSLPNDSEVRKILGYTSINQSDQVTGKMFIMYSNGNVIAIGKLYIKSVSDTIELFFISGNSNWINRITGSIKDINMSQYNVTLTAGHIDALKTATDGVIFPVMDWMYNFKKLTNTFQVTPIFGFNADQVVELYPCIYEHTIMEKIADLYSLKFTGPLMDDAIYQSLVITPEQIVPENFIAPGGNYSVLMRTAKQQTVNNTTALLTMDEVTGDIGATDFYDFVSATSRIVVNNDFEGGTVYAGLNAEIAVSTPRNITITVYKNGSPFITKVFVLTSTFMGLYINNTDLGPVSTGDYFQLYAQVSGYSVGIGQAYLGLNLQNSLNLVRIKNIMPDIDQFAFIKHIAQRFNCLVDFDDITQTVTFTPLDKIDKTSALDISDKIISYKQIPNSGYAARNYLRSESASELLPFKANNLNYGDLLIASDGDGDQDVINTVFRPAASDINQRLNWLMTYVPLITLEDQDEGVGYTSVGSSAGDTLFASTVANQFVGYLVGSIVRIDSANGNYEGYGVVSSANNIGLFIRGLTISTSADTGRIYKQRISFPFCGSRELIVIRNTSVNNYNAGSPIYGDQNIKIYDGATYPYATSAFAYYAKTNINTALDSAKIGLNYGAINGITNIPFGVAYNKTLTKIVAGRQLECSLLLSETEYYNLSYATYYYVQTKDASGYFIITDLSGYIDSKTPIIFTLALIS